MKTIRLVWKGDYADYHIIVSGLAAEVLCMGEQICAYTSDTDNYINQALDFMVHYDAANHQATIEYQRAHRL